MCERERERERDERFSSWSTSNNIASKLEKIEKEGERKWVGGREGGMND